MVLVKGIIYRIICLSHPEIQYIGGTFNQLRWRWQQHKSDYKRYLNGNHSEVSIFPYFTQYGIENFKMIKIKDYIVYAEDKKDHKHLSAYEQLWINKLKCVNKILAFNPLRENERWIKLGKAEYRANMTADQIEKKNAKKRNENLTQEQIEKKNAKKRNENLTQEQIEKKNAKQKVENMTEDQIEKQRERDRIRGKKTNEKIKNDHKLLDDKRKKQRECCKLPWTCNICNVTITNGHKSRHLKYKSHLENLAKKTTII